MDGMKSINEMFKKEEYNQLIKVKGDRTWHDFIMMLVNIKAKK